MTTSYKRESFYKELEVTDKKISTFSFESKDLKLTSIKWFKGSRSRGLH